MSPEGLTVTIPTNVLLTQRKQKQKQKQNKTKKTTKKIKLNMTHKFLQ